jgi:aminopeptidase N
MKKISATAIAVVFLVFHSFAQPNFRDSIDILEYQIHLDLSKTQTKQIWGNCDIKLKPVYELSKIKLDLEGLRTDSVLSNGKSLKFSFNGTQLQIYPETKLNSTDTFNISVYYHGTPKQDQSWGGFFIENDYAFNYGVGMASTPPNYGRVWFPCIDNFTDRALYEYFIKTKGNQKAACPGLLLSEIHQSDGTIIYHWKLGQSIPTYLSSVAVANYSAIKDTVQGIERIIPIEIYTEKGTETKTKYAFKNLKIFFHAFESRFGPYQWDKIGYVSTAFMSGAMEHATNIAYSSYCNGSSSCESTLAHEFSHHWFGDLVTCASEKDMWLNEGWASYCEAIYYEYAGGEAAYKDHVRENHKNVLIYAINNPTAYGSLYGMPHSDTYGTVVYDKGADIAHTLRGQIGDSLFFGALKEYFKDYAFKCISVEEFKNYMSKKTNIDLKDFFDFWVYAPGFPHFSINDLKVKQVKNKYQVNFTINQRLVRTDKYLNSSNIELGILDKNLKMNIYNLKQARNICSQNLLLDYDPKLLILDPNEKISDAITDECLTIDKPITRQFPTENMTLNLNSLIYPAFFHIAYNWIAPEQDKREKNIKKMYDKYWEINYYSNGTIDPTAKLYFRLSSAFNIQSGAADKQSLSLLFREKNDDEWKIIESKPEIRGQEGVFEIKNFKQGQYTISILE